MKVKNDDYQKYYELIQLIGTGENTKVYKGKSKNEQKERAIKVIELGDNEVKCIKGEVDNMKKCSENNINSVKIYDCYHSKTNLKNEFAIIMELCDDNLQKILEKRGKGFTELGIQTIMNQLNKTFRKMYDNNIIHRDIKLANIVTKKDENSGLGFISKLTDYGISKKLTDTGGNTKAIGTNFTMAPEVIAGDEYDHKCDLWSIGIIIYQLYFNEYPYKGDTITAIYNNIKNLGQKKLKKTDDDLLNDLINKLLKKNPNERIDYPEYFNHPFFKDHPYELNKENLLITLKGFIE